VVGSFGVGVDCKIQFRLIPRWSLRIERVFWPPTYRYFSFSYLHLPSEKSSLKEFHIIINSSTSTFFILSTFLMHSCCLSFKTYISLSIPKSFVYHRGYQNFKSFLSYSHDKVYLFACFFTVHATLPPNLINNLEMTQSKPFPRKKAGWKSKENLLTSMENILRMVEMKHMLLLLL